MCGKNEQKPQNTINMAGGKMSPRQKMINMMYLVLIALLALNVSKEVLDAFVLINQGLVKTTANFAAKNEKIYENFTTAATLNPAKAKHWEQKAIEVRAQANAIVGYLEDLKIALVIEIEGLNPEDRERLANLILSQTNAVQGSINEMKIGMNASFVKQDKATDTIIGKQEETNKLLG